MELTGDQFERLEQALLAAYPTKDELRLMVRVAFDIPLQTVAEGDNHTVRVGQLIEWAESEGKVVELVRAAHRRKPDKAEIRSFCEAFSQDFLKHACQPNLSQLSHDVVAAFVTLPLGAVPSEDWLASGLSVLPGGAADDPEDKDWKDFQNEALSLTIRSYGFLKLALGKFPRKDDLPTLLVFARELHERLSDSVAAKPFLTNWLQQAESEIAPPTPSPSSRARARRAMNGTLDVSLMITVRRCAKQQDGQPLQYQVEGWLFFDQISGLESPHLEPKPPQCLALPETPDQLGTVATWNQLPQRVDDFLDEAISQLGHQIRRELGYRAYNLTLEMFLPVNYMGEAIDQWPRPPRDTPLGQDYGVVMRFCERVYDDERLNQIYLAWDDLQEKIQSQATLQDHIEAPTDLSQYTSWRDLERRLKSKLGLKLCCGLPDSEADRKGIFEAMLYGDIPVAVWVRQSNVVDVDANPAQPVDVPQALTAYFERDCFQHPTKLAAKLKAVRQQSCLDQNDERYGRCLGDQIAGLLDNPDRLPLPPSLAS